MIKNKFFYCGFKEKKFLEKIFFILLFPFYLMELLLIVIYKFFISPLLPNVCKFVPTCSIYFYCSLKEYGVFKGTFLGLKRLIKCNPWNKGGFDPVKPNIKGKIKWIL